MPSSGDTGGDCRKNLVAFATPGYIQVPLCVQSMEQVAFLSIFLKDMQTRASMQTNIFLLHRRLESESGSV